MTVNNDEQPQMSLDEPEPQSTSPDYLTSPDAVFNDEGVQWRYGKAPDYSKTRKFWEETKRMSHAAGSLPQLVENLVKNWEVEASFKPRLSDWRTIDHDNYSFAMNGGPAQTAEHMIQIGTYNGIIASNDYYCPKSSDFATSHKTFKRMMPTFAWEVLEVYSGPPRVAFRWRHWGVMKNDYVGFNDKGEKITARAHGDVIEIQGVTVAQVDEKVRLQSVETWMDPLEMFRQIAPEGVVERKVMNGNEVNEEDAAIEENGDGNLPIKEKEQPTVDQEMELPKAPAPALGDLALKEIIQSEEHIFLDQPDLGETNAASCGLRPLNGSDTSSVGTGSDFVNVEIEQSPLVVETTPHSPDDDRHNDEANFTITHIDDGEMESDKMEPRAPEITINTDQDCSHVGEERFEEFVHEQSSPEDITRSMYSSVVGGEGEIVSHPTKGDEGSYDFVNFEDDTAICCFPRPLCPMQEEVIQAPIDDATPAAHESVERMQTIHEETNGVERPQTTREETNGVDRAQTTQEETNDFFVGECPFFMSRH